jgi:hypothetical protein
VVVEQAQQLAEAVEEVRAIPELPCDGGAVRPRRWAGRSSLEDQLLIRQ